MDSLEPLLTDLSQTLTHLESTLHPLLTTSSLTSTTTKLPLLDRAKLYILVVYTLESLLFSSLRLSGSDATAHPVFKELARVKEYFGKIAAAENSGKEGGKGGKGRLDVGAAGRFIKAGLAGNDREKLGAKRKVEEYEGVGTHTRFDGLGKRIRSGEEVGEDQGEQVGVVRASEVESSSDGEGGSRGEQGEQGEDGGKETSMSKPSSRKAASSTSRGRKKKETNRTAKRR